MEEEMARGRRKEKAKKDREGEEAAYRGRY